MKKDFKSYAKYLRENHLDELIKKNLELSKTMDIPIMRLFKHLSDEQLLEMSKPAMEGILLSIEDGTFWEKTEVTYQQWKEDKLQDISKHDIHPNDIILINAVRKKGFMSFVSYFSYEIDEISALISEMDDFFRDCDRTGMEVIYFIQKETENKYKESEERYRDLFENANDLIHIADIEGNILFANKVWLNTTGYRSEDIPKLTIQQIIHPDYLNTYIEQRKNVIEGNEPEEFSFAIISSSEKKTYLEGCISCQFIDGKAITTRGIFTNITEKKINEEKLRIYTKNLVESEQKYRLLVENIKDYSIFMISPEGLVMSWNKGAEQIKGYTTAEIVGKHISVFYPLKLINDEGPEYLLAMAKEHGRCEVENLRVRKDGSQFWANIVLTALYDNEGILKGFVKITRDITEQKEAADKIKTSEGKLKAIFDHAPDAIIIADMKLNISGWNLAAEKTYGYTSEEVLGRNGIEFLFAEFTAPYTLETALAEMSEKGSWTGEVVTKNKSGETITIISSITTLFDKNGNPSEILSVNKDITERKKADVRLKESESKLQAIFDHAPDAIIVSDLEQKITSWNKAAEKMYGYTLEEVLGKKGVEILPAEFDGSYTLEQASNEMKEKGTWEGEATTVTKNGEKIVVIASATTLYDEMGNPSGILAVNKDISDRKKSDEKIAKTLQLLNEAEQVAHFGSWEINLKTNEITWSDELYRIYGLEPSETESLWNVFYKYIHPEDKDLVVNSAEKVIEDKQPISVDYRIINDKGELKTLKANCSITSNISDTEFKLTGTVQDITEQKAKDNKITKTLQQLNEAQQMAHIGSWEKDLKTKMLTWSDEMYRIHGLEPFDHDPQINVFLKYTHPEDHDYITNIIAEAIKNKKAYTFDYRILDAQQNHRILQAHGNVITDDKGNTIKLRGTLQDITERKEADDKIAKSLQQLNEAQKLAHIGSWEWDVMNNVITWSDELYRIFGLLPNEFVATYDGYMNYIHPDDRTRVNELLTEALEIKKPFKFDHKILRQDGSVRIVNSHGVVSINTDGYVTKMSGTAQDITERVLSKEELKKAEDTVKAKQQFLSNMSHEIRTPLNSIIGFTKVVLKSNLNLKQREYLDAIKLSGQTLLVLINDILDLAKVDSGKMIFEKIPFKLSSSVASMLHLFDSKVKEKNIKLLNEYDNQIPEVLIGDPVRFHQIILNLVSNAIKFTEQGKIVMKSLLIEELANSVKIEFKISDTGIGIHEDKLETIFENFQQGSSSTARLYGGTGLGLAIVKNLITHQGGTIEVNSKVKKGTTFTFWLTFEKAGINELIHAEEEINDELLISNVKILVVEDVDLNKLLMQAILDDYGYDYDIAENGRVAIEKLKTDKFDIVLMDLQMPEMNGFETTEYIRTKMPYPLSDIPIIALTADVTSVDIERCLAVGMNDYTTKPIDEKLLINKINKQLKQPFKEEEELEEVKEDRSNIKEKYINLEYMKNKVKGNSELMKQMIKVYLEQTPDMIRRMRESLESQDWETLHKAAHRIIPSFAIVGIDPEFEGMAKKIEEFAYLQEQVDEIHEMFLKIEEVCLRACIELEEEYNTLL